MEVLIAGGGIAGLSLALTCHEVGVSVRVFETARTVRPLGLGINLQPSAVRELFEMGFERELASIGVPLRELALVDRNGNDVLTEPCGREAGSRWPQYSVHRGELQMMLYRAVLDRLGPNAVVTGQKVNGYIHAYDGVQVEVASADGTPATLDARVLIGADGLHSTVRAQMFPGDGGPRWGGTVLWRGVAESPPIRGESTFVVVGNSEQRFVTFPIAEPDPVTGLQTQNWIAERWFDPNRGWRRGDWNTRVSINEFIGDFEDWNFDWLDVPALVRSSRIIFEYPMVDRDPVGHWVHGSVALIGDAAHPMYPIGSNGASQAIVDSRVLGASFIEHGVGNDALHAFESTRLDDMSELVLRNRGAGPFSVLGVGDERCGRMYDGFVSNSDAAQIIASYRAAAGSAIEELNSAPPTIAPTR